MISPNINSLLQQTKVLSSEERERFLELVKRQSLQEQPQSTEDELVAALAKKGIKLTVPPKPTPEAIARFKAWRPIEMPGGSLSDELIRDRR
jgi:hypothetical protein